MKRFKSKKWIIGVTTVLVCTLAPLPVTYNTSKVEAKSSISVERLSTKKKISKKKAKKIALKKVPGATIVKCQLDYDDGQWKYEIDLYKGDYEYDIEINAYSGSIIKYDKDYNDNDYDYDDDYDDDWDD